MLNLPTPTLNLFADLSVQVDKPQEVGSTHHGVRRLIPILGGQVEGNGWTARVLPGGADFQLIVGDGTQAHFGPGAEGEPRAARADA